MLPDMYVHDFLLAVRCSFRVFMNMTGRCDVFFHGERHREGFRTAELRARGTRKLKAKQRPLVALVLP